MAGLRKLINDENNIERIQKLHGSKKTANAAVEKQQKRRALGELVNKPIVPNSGSLLNKVREVTASQESLLKNTKAKVDTFWKNKDGRKIIRTESLKSIKNTVNAPESNAAVATNRITLRNTTKINPTVHTTNVAVKDGKPAIFKATKHIATKKEELPIQKAIANKKNEVHVIRREESNLSRKSLTKLRAVLSKDASKKDAIVATKTENGIVIRKKITKSISSSALNINNNNIKVIEKVKIKESFLPEPSNVELKKKIDDIDANDSDNIFALPEYVNDIFKYLKELEEKHKIKEDFMKNQIEATSRMRSVLLDWLNEVAHQFHLVPETYQIAVGIIDRYLQIEQKTTKAQLQLVGVTALFIATKYEEIYSSDINDFIYMTDNSYTKDEIIEMEKTIMKTLNFDLSRPVPLVFLRRFSKALFADQSEHLLAKYILELVTIEYSLAHYKPSEIAAAALYLSIQLLNLRKNSKTKLWNETMEHYSGYTSTYLEPLTKKIAIILKNAPKAKNKSIYLKFKTEKFNKISIRQELYGKKIDSIIGSPDSK